MVFVSKNAEIKICKYCDRPAKEAFKKILQKNGKKRKKGFYRTCGSAECQTQQYRDSQICAKKGISRQLKDYECAICYNKFKPISPPHKRYCLECVPDKSWRGRANRYGIGKKQWDELIEKQNYKCALCERNPEVVDHCHTNHYVRGLLCNYCNTHIKFLDMPNEFQQRAKEYISNGPVQKSETKSLSACERACDSEEVGSGNATPKKIAKDGKIKGKKAKRKVKHDS